MIDYVSAMIGLCMGYHSAMAIIGKVSEIVSYCIVITYKSLGCRCCCCNYVLFYFYFILFYFILVFFFLYFYKYIQYKELN
jgi:hypothetical protein